MFKYKVVAFGTRTQCEDRLHSCVFRFVALLLCTEVKRRAELYADSHLVVSWIRWQGRILERLSKPKHVKV